MDNETVYTVPQFVAKEKLILHIEEMLPRNTVSAYKWPTLP